MSDPIWQFSLQALHALGWFATLVVAVVVFVKFFELRKLVYATTLLTLFLVALGAYVRLTDAGLGCPDWPGCYGKLSPFHAEVEILDAERLSPAGPVSAPKAWKEMIHRYLASLVGAMITAIVLKVLYMRQRVQRGREQPDLSLGLPLLLLGLVVLQGLFGKWTVTLLLKPAIVTVHLLGGMVILAALTWLSAKHLRPPAAGRPAEARLLRPLGLLGLVLVMIQIALGGWVSTNYAALACIDFPTCHGRWMPDMDFGHAFQLQRELGMTKAGAPLSNAALNAIHWTHRIGALVVAAYLGAVTLVAFRMTGLRVYAMALATVLVIQLLFGITNILAMLPLAVALAHNVGAALLLMSVVMLNFAIFQESTR
ncbi:MAG: COX15/CtaA family protein [Betaproteobacteria bacterium]|nr:MAG: COX15/CtaA family protein [Betaproteobacteria bacterium]